MNGDFQKAIKARMTEIMKGKVTELPISDLVARADLPEPYALVRAVNETFALGWAAAEADLIEAYQLLEMMAVDPVCRLELEEMARKAPRNDDFLLYRRDWFLYERAKELVSRFERPPGCLPTPKSKARKAKPVKAPKSKKQPAARRR